LGTVERAGVRLDWVHNAPAQARTARLKVRGAPREGGGGVMARDAPYTLHPTPYSLQPTPCTVHRAPYTLHPTPYTLHPTPHTPYTPYTLHPIHPTPYTLTAPREDGGGVMARDGPLQGAEPGVGFGV